MMISSRTLIYHFFVVPELLRKRIKKFNSIPLLFSLWIVKVKFSVLVPLPGEGPKLDTIELNLEDLLELQHLRDPVCS